MINFPRRFTAPPSPWFNGIQLRLEKILGKPYINKLRVIVLLEFDMNTHFTITIGRQMIWNAEDNHLLDDIPQYSNRSGKSAISAVLLKRLTYDILHQLRKNAAALNSDAAGAFDRMIPSFGMICIRRLGVPRKIIDLKLQVLRQTRLAAVQRSVDRGKKPERTRYGYRHR
jgi:hypothetical protein